MHQPRRRYLRSLGGAVVLSGLAGCTGSSDETPSPGTNDSNGTPPSGPDDADETPPSGTDDTNETRPEGTGGPGVTLVSTDDDPELPIEPAVELVRDTATEDHPPRLRTTLTNTSDESVTVGEGRAVHFEYVSDDAGVLTLLPANSQYPADPDCWRLTEGIAITDEYRTFEIDADGSSSRLVDLYATPAADGCLPVGEYRFETTVTLVSDDTETEPSVTWGFSILLE